MKAYVARLVVALLALVFISSCETAEDQSIEAARQCTDAASQLSLTPGTSSLAAQQAPACEAKLNGVNSPEANKILFGDILLEDQLIGAIAQAASARKGQNGQSQDGMASMLQLLVPNTTDPVTGAQAAANLGRITNVAAATGDAGIILVANLIFTAQTLNNFIGGITPSTTPAQIVTDINNCAGNVNNCAGAIASSFPTMLAAACASPYDNTSTDPNNMCVKMKGIQTQAMNTYGAAWQDPTNLVTSISVYLNTTH